MRRKNYGSHAVALAIVVVGALWVGLPVGSLAVFGLFVMCPLMMFFMMTTAGRQPSARTSERVVTGPVRMNW